MQKIALVGNPNTGKTTLFNSLTNLSEHVGNWHGVTVDKKESFLSFMNEELFIVDLPGTYSLNSYSFEEEVTQEYLLQNDAYILNICDANNLKRNLFLTLDLIERNYNPILVINMANELKKSGATIDVSLLQKTLGIKVFLINAKNKKETKEMLKSVLCLIKENTFKKANKLILKNNFDLFMSFKDKLSKLLPQKNVDTICEQYNLSQNEVLFNILTYNKLFINKLNLTQEKQEEIEKFIEKNQILEKLAKNKYDKINEIVSKTINRKKNIVYGYSPLDKIFLNKYLALPLFLLIIALIFYITFMGIGVFFSSLLSRLIDFIIFEPLQNLLYKVTVNDFVIKLIEEGVLGGASSVISFLPQVLILTTCLNILEQTGYMSRLAFCLEDIFSRVGLSGKSVFALLMGFGCSTTASMSARGMEDKNSKIKTAMLTPYISCTAKLPLYLVVCGAYFKAQSFLIIFLLYILGVLLAILVSYILEKTCLPSKSNSFILEFPAFRKPSFLLILKLALIDAKNFLIRIGSVIISFSCIIWICQNCTFTLKYIVNGENESILEFLGKIFAPLFKPLGFNSAGIVSALICGVVAKEIIVSSLKIINNAPSLNYTSISQTLTNINSAIYLSPATSLSFLVFSSIYLPCISTMAVLKKEIGLKWTIFACLLEFSIAYILAFLVYRISAVYFSFGLISCLLCCFAFGVFLISFIFVVKYFKKKNKCKYCACAKNCNNNC